MNYLLHKITLLHLVLAKGNVETWWEGEHLMVGFRCICGNLLDSFESSKSSLGTP